jgi:putative Holliday junction resolvase
VYAVDYGRARTGLAVLIAGVVLPLDPLLDGRWSALLGRLRALADEHGSGTVVLGLPLSASGKPTELSVEVEALASWLRAEGLVVVLETETGTTVEAIQHGMRDRRDGRLDSVAASVLLERYLAKSGQRGGSRA